jgi:6-methylsalicylate decarboxylase
LAGVRIDAHAHYWTDTYLDMLVALGKTHAATQRGIRAGGGAELDTRLRLMDRAGVDRATAMPHVDAAINEMSCAIDEFGMVRLTMNTRARVSRTIRSIHCGTSTVRPR